MTARTYFKKSKRPHNRWWTSTLILLLAAAPHFHQFLLTRGTCFDTDDGFQVAAAINWQEVGRYETIVPNPMLSDAPVYKRPDWPPTYSLLILLLLKLGIPVMWSVLFWKSAFLAAATVGWYRLASEILGKGPLAAFMVVPILWLVSMSPTDLFCCSVAPFVLLTLARIVRTKVRRANNRRLLFISGMVAAMVSLKYSALYFIPGTLVVLAVDSIRKGTPRVDLLARFAVAIPATAIFLCLYLSSIQVTSTPLKPGVAQTRPSDVVRVLKGESDLKIERLISLPITTLLLDPLKLNSVVRRAAPLLASWTSTEWLWWKRFLELSLVSFVIGILLYSAREHRQPEDVRTWLYLFVSFGLWCAMFLVLVDLGRGEIGHVRIFRYYAPVAPVLLVMLTHSVRSLTCKKHTATSVVAVCILLAFLPLAGWIAAQVSSTISARDVGFERGAEFVTRTSRLIHKGEQAVYFGHLRTFCQVDLPVANLPRDNFWREAKAERPAWLFLVLNRIASSEPYLNNIDHLAREFQLSRKEWNGWEIHYARLDSGWVGRHHAGD